MDEPLDLVVQMQTRLTDAHAFNEVAGMVDLSILSASDIRGAQNANAWVGEVDTNPLESEFSGMAQVERQTFGVVIGVRAINDPTGNSARSLLREKRLAVRQAMLFDWQPEGGYLKFELAGSGLVKFVSGALFYIERFRTQKIITKDSLL